MNLETAAAETIYTDKGYASRYDYLLQLCEKYCLERSIVFSVASLLGENEDFDELVTTLNGLA